MREIKFRVWSAKLKEMLLVDKLDLTGDEGAIVFDENADEHYFTNSPIMQYTGLKDKNGKDIYEGDIIEYDDIQQHYGKETRTRIKAIVEYHPCRFLCGQITLGDYSPKHFQMEIIGNIYENLELIK